MLMRYKELIYLNLLFYVLKIQLCEVFIIDTIYLESFVDRFENVVLLSSWMKDFLRKKSVKTLNGKSTKMQTFSKSYTYSFHLVQTIIKLKIKTLSVNFQPVGWIRKSNENWELICISRFLEIENLRTSLSLWIDSWRYNTLLYVGFFDGSFRQDFRKRNSFLRSTDTKIILAYQ